MATSTSEWTDRHLTESKTNSSCWYWLLIAGLFACHPMWVGWVRVESKTEPTQHVNMPIMSVQSTSSIWLFIIWFLDSEWTLIYCINEKIWIYFFCLKKKILVALINSKLVDFVKSIIVESTLLSISNSDIQDSNLFYPL